MELRQLRYFVAVADELHVGRAAQRLFMAQSSLSQAIALLERELGTTLFRRHPRGVDLTPDGADLLPRARAVLASADELTSAAGRAAVAAPPLTVGHVEYARAAVPALVDRLRRHRPDARLLLRSGNDSSEVLDDLRQGHTDAAVLRTPLPDGTALECVALAREPFVAALPRHHALAERPVLALADLAGESFALFAREVNPPAYDHLMGFFADAGYRPRVEQHSRRMVESLMFVAAGCGVGLFPKPVADATSDPGLAFRPLVDPTPHVELVLAWKRPVRHPLLPALAAAASSPDRCGR